LIKKDSIHLEDWPKVDQKAVDQKLEQKMELVRKVVNLGLKSRARVQIKVRQPLPELKISGIQLESEFFDLIKEELNIKKIQLVRKLRQREQWLLETEEKLKVALNTEITKKLKEEGIIREFIRQVQGLRKQAGLKPKDKILIQYSDSISLIKILKKNKKFILKEAKAEDLRMVKNSEKISGTKKEVRVEEEKIYLGITKI
jgi:isoleucyl-tRNA synthetase